MTRLRTVKSVSQANFRLPMLRRSAWIVGRVNTRIRQGMMKRMTVCHVGRASTRRRWLRSRKQHALSAGRAHTLQPPEQARWTPAKRAGRVRSRVLGAVIACWWLVQPTQTVNSRAAMTSRAQNLMVRWTLLLISTATTASGMQSAAQRRMNA